MNSANVSSDLVLPIGSISKERAKEQPISSAVSNAASMQLCQYLPLCSTAVINWDICCVRRSLNALQSEVTYGETSTQHTKKLGGFVYIK